MSWLKEACKARAGWHTCAGHHISMPWPLLRAGLLSILLCNLFVMIFIDLTACQRLLQAHAPSGEYNLHSGFAFARHIFFTAPSVRGCPLLWTSALISDCSCNSAWFAFVQGEHLAAWAVVGANNSTEVVQTAAREQSVYKFSGIRWRGSVGRRTTTHHHIFRRIWDVSKQKSNLVQQVNVGTKLSARQ